MKEALQEFRGRRTRTSPARQSSPLKAKVESLQKELAEEKNKKEQALEELARVKTLCDEVKEENNVLKEQVSHLREELQVSETALVRSYITVTEKELEIDNLERELVEESSSQGDGDWTLKVTQHEVQDRVDTEEFGEANQTEMEERNATMPSTLLREEIMAAPMAWRLEPRC